MTYVPSPQAQDEVDTGHLKVLSIFWYIISALQALFGCVGCIWIGIAVLAVIGGSSSGTAEDRQAGAGAGAVFACVGVAILLFWWFWAFINFTVARSLPKRKNRTICFVMGILVCFAFPLGTILGVCTLMVLSRPSVKARSL